MDVAIVVLVPQGRPNVEDAPKPHPDLPPGWGFGLVGQRKKGRPDGRPPQGRCQRRDCPIIVQSREITSGLEHERRAPASDDCKHASARPRRAGFLRIRLPHPQPVIGERREPLLIIHGHYGSFRRSQARGPGERGRCIARRKVMRSTRPAGGSWSASASSDFMRLPWALRLTAAVRSTSDRRKLAAPDPALRASMAQTAPEADPQKPGGPEACLQSRSPFPSSSGSRAMLTAMRRASSFVRTLACSASASLSRE
jgi:hypothetical protein